VFAQKAQDHDGLKQQRVKPPAVALPFRRWRVGVPASSNDDANQLVVMAPTSFYPEPQRT